MPDLICFLINKYINYYITWYSSILHTKEQIKMNININSLYQLNTPQFQNLYSKEVSNEVLMLLISAVVSGNQNCIDLLYNLTLRKDDLDITLRKLFLISQ